MKATYVRPWGGLAVGIALVGSLTAQAQSELVFQDNFNVSAPTWDINEEIDAGRQTGTAGVVRYLEKEDTAAGGVLDDFTQIYDDGAGSRLSLTVSDWTWVSPDRDFTDGPTFAIEFDLNPSVLDPGRTSDDWAAIVFGATAPGQFVNASDGVGILFRSSGLIQVFDGTTLVHENTAETALPAGELHIRIEVTGQGFDGTADATVALFVNGDPAPLTDTEDVYVRPGGFRGNYLTLQGYAAEGNLWEYLFDNLTVRADTCVRLDPSQIVLMEGDPTQVSLAVKVPPNFNGGQGGAVTLSSSNPEVVSLVGAEDNRLVLDFPPGGPTTQTVEAQVVGSGRARILLTTDAPDCVADPAVILTPLRGIVRNPSFEYNYNPAWPHYSAVDEWTDGSGVNEADGPFHDNGAIPDQRRVAFLQGTVSMSQQITGLQPGQPYWLQLRYNARNCCGGETPDMTVFVDGAPLGSEAAIQPANGPYYFRNFEFVPTAEVALVEIATQPHGGGDSTLLIDAVTVVPREPGNVVVQNPSFEASGLIPLPGVFGDQAISGWQAEGTVGVNLAGDPFADNGVTPDQDLAAFIQGPGALSQTLPGLIPGETYQVEFAANARSTDTPHLRVTADDAVVFDGDITPVGSGPYHVVSGSFVASGQVSDALTVKVLDEVVADGPATVTVTSSDPAVAMLPDAADGVLTLTFQPGDQTKQVRVAGVAKGGATLLFSESRGVCFDKPGVQVRVLGAFVRNPSFEDNSHPSFPGYGPIDAWDSEGSGNVGINGPAGPFHDNGVIPDRGQVAAGEALLASVLLQRAQLLRRHDRPAGPVRRRGAGRLP